MNIEEAIDSLSVGKRNFVQSYDLIVTLKNIDMKNPESRFSKDIVLPHGRGKEVTVGIISDNAEDALTKEKVEEISKDAKKIRRFMRKYDFLLCEAPLMAMVGKTMGRYLGPKGMMPKLLPPKTDTKRMVEDAKRSVRMRLVSAPCIQTTVGSQSQKPEEIKANVQAVLAEVEKSLPKGRNQIKSVYLKTTMGKPVRIDVM